MISLETKEHPKVFDDVIEALKELAPTGSRVLTVGKAPDIARHGYIPVTEEPDVVIGCGGEEEFGIAHGRRGDGMLILVPDRDHQAAASPRYRTRDGAFCKIRTGRAPDALVISGTIQNAASVFGGLAALELCAFDMNFAKRMNGETADERAADVVAGLVTNTTEAVLRVAKTPEAGDTLKRACISAAGIVSKTPDLVYASGASQCYEAMRMLYAAENRAPGARGETEFLLCGYIIDYYIKNLSVDEFSFPPDNVRRMDSLCEYLGADLRRAAVHVSPIYPPQRLRLCDYRRHEFGTELIRALAAIKKRWTAAYRAFKRLYEDDGYRAQSLIDITDLPLILALAPDVLAADTALSFFKQTGRLERYIV